MSNGAMRVRRREFLATAASAFGAGTLGLLPTGGLAQGVGSGSAGPGLVLLFWNGTNFVPAANVAPAILNSDEVNVRIEGFGNSPSIAAIDVQMPGGVFEAFTAKPQGQKAVAFPAPVATPLGLSLRITDGDTLTPLALHADSTPGPKLAFGTYLLTDARVAAGQFVLTASPDAPIVTLDGQPAAFPYVLITLSE
ncbi:MAG TPA: hypothetical protein VKT78_18450 [Fimbriimonadaceae bacterium]|nr:hypothetical protein [Fimbriimonadaceae bacterium]